MMEYLYLEVAQVYLSPTWKYSLGSHLSANYSEPKKWKLQGPEKLLWPLESRFFLEFKTFSVS